MKGYVAIIAFFSKNFLCKYTIIAGPAIKRIIKGKIEYVMAFFYLKLKLNPVLLGEAGVGKTTFAEGLALHVNKRVKL